MKPDILAVIPARGGSKTVPRKNIKSLCGKPLIAYAIEEAKKSRHITRVIVSTDDQEIAAISKEHGAKIPFLRPLDLSGDYVTDLPVFTHALEWLRTNDGYSPDIVVHLRPTAPLRRVWHIDAGIQMLLEHPEADCVRSVCDAPKNPLKMWRIENHRLMPFIDGADYGLREAYNMPRQKLPSAYIQNGSVDVIRATTITEKGSMTGDIIIPLVMKENESVNIDTEMDFLIAELIMKGQKGE